jgi:hypothetical protein
VWFVKGQELISFEEMFDIEESVHTEEIYDGEWEKSLVEQFKIREDSEIRNCESDDEGDDIEMDNTGSEYSHDDMLRNITHMINFANTKDDCYLKFLLPMQSMTEDTIVRRTMVKKTRNTCYVCLLNYYYCVIIKQYFSLKYLFNIIQFITKVIKIQWLCASLVSVVKPFPPPFH